MAVETVPMDDKELFSSALADETPPPAESIPLQATELEEPTTEQPRDEHGRFAPKTEAPQADAAPIQQQPEVKTEQKDEDGAQVPSWRLREVREAREAAERRAEEAGRQAYALQQQMQAMHRQLQQLQQPKQEPVDFFADPNAAFKQQVAPLQEQFQSLQAEMRMNTSRALAVARHGWEAVAEMEDAVSKMRPNDPSILALQGQLATTNDPVGTAMQWYSGQKVWNETGGDMAKYRERVLAEAMKDPAYQAKVLEAARNGAQQPNGSPPNIKLPPSLNKTAGSGITQSDLNSEDMSDRALFKYAAPGR